MDVGSGTVRGEITRLVKKVEQKIADFQTACGLARKYIPAAVTKHAGETAQGLLEGLVKFALEAAAILAASTAAGALIGALFGGVGAVPGAEIGFEIGLLILEIYGLLTLVEAILKIAGNFMSQLGEFIQLVWDANGDAKQLDLAGRTLADAVGILASAALIAGAAYLMKKGGEAFAKSKFARTLGESDIMKWLKERQKLGTSRKTVAKRFVNAIVDNPKSIVGKTADEIAKLFNDAGFPAKVEQSTKKGTSGKAVQVRIDGHPQITNIQFHPGGGRHTPEGVPYWKVSTNSGKIWVAPRTFKGAEQLGGTIIFYD
jgi:hypothetical protein